MIYYGIWEDTYNFVVFKNNISDSVVSQQRQLRQKKKKSNYGESRLLCTLGRQRQSLAVSGSEEPGGSVDLQSGNTTDMWPISRSVMATSGGWLLVGRICKEQKPPAN